MFRIGCHISSAGGYLAMGQRAVALGANTLAFFTRNPRGGSAKAADPADARAFLVLCSAEDIDLLVAHAPWSSRRGSFITSTPAATSGRASRSALRRSSRC